MFGFLCASSGAVLMAIPVEAPTLNASPILPRIEMSWVAMYQNATTDPGVLDRDVGVEDPLVVAVAVQRPHHLVRRVRGSVPDIRVSAGATPTSRNGTAHISI